MILLAFTTWDPKAKYRKSESCTCGCSEPKDCTCGHHQHEEPCGCEDEETNDGCGCPPPGLLSVKNGDGSFAGFLTPNDAQGFMNTIYACPPGYVKDLDDAGNFRSCLLPDQYLLLHPIV